MLPAARARPPAPGPAERSFLLGLLPCTSDHTPAPFPAGGNAELIWEYVELHGLGGVLGSVAARIAGLPPSLAEAARHCYLSNSLKGEQARRCCMAIMDTARREGLDVFIVKGPAIAELGYADYGLRGFSDLDLFTSSAESARRLARACGAQIQDDVEERSIPGEVWDPARLVAELDGWTLEIRFPAPGWKGPLFELFPDGRLPELERTTRGLVVPRIEWHLLFLLQHLMIHHFFGRLVWMRDLAVLAGRNRAKLDWNLVVREAERMALRDGLCLAAEFCRAYVDADFPSVPPRGGHSWNLGFLRKLTSPAVIVSSEWGTEWNERRDSPLRRARSALYEVAVFFLMADVPKSGGPCNSQGWRWTADRIGYVLVRRWRGRFGNWLGRQIAMFAPWFVYPLARLLAWIAGG
jgi:hypothetical protein